MKGNPAPSLIPLRPPSVHLIQAFAWTSSSSSSSSVEEEEEDVFYIYYFLGSIELWSRGYTERRRARTIAL